MSHPHHIRNASWYPCAMIRREPRIAWQRFWCPRDARYPVDNDGFVRAPHSWSGHECWEPTASERLAAMPCLMLLGEPGIGKSCALVDMVDATRRRLPVDDVLLAVDLRDHGDIDDVFARPEFRAWRADERVLWLFVDSLDERRNVDDASRLLGALGDGPMHRLRLRVACRTGELPLRFDRALADWWGDAKSVAHLELLPLTRDDVVVAARAADLDAEAFLSEVLHRDVVALATRPITLQFLIEMFRAQRGLSKDRGELYRSGCAYLCRELSNSRRDHQQHGSLDEEQRLAIARGTAAASVPAQKHVIYFRRPLAGLPPDAMDLQGLAGGRTSDTRVPFAITTEAVKEVIVQTGLFTARGEGCFGWAHLTYAEFLAAEHLHERIRDADGLRPILMPASLGGQVPLALRGVAGWLSTRDDALFSALLADDVSVLLHADLGQHSDGQRAAIIAHLLDRVSAADLLQPDVPGATYVRLQHPALSEQLRPWIENPRAYFMARHLAINIARRCTLTSLAPSLLQIACDEDDDAELRAAALATLTAIAGPEIRARVRPLLASPNDPNDQLRGYALAFLRTELDTDELIRHLAPPNNPSYIGKYYSFVNYELIPTIPDEDLPRMLDWLQGFSDHQPGMRTVNFIYRAAQMLQRRAWSAIHRPDVLSRLTRIVGARLKRGEDVFEHDVPDLEPGAAELLKDDDHRRLLVAALVASDAFPGIAGFQFIRKGLVRADDLGWLVQAFDHASGEELPERWIELIACRILMEGCRDDDVDAAVALAERHPPLLGQLRRVLGAIELGSPEAESMRRNHEENERVTVMHRDYVAREGSDLTPTERMQHLLGRTERGERGALSSVLSALRVEAGGRPWMWVCADLSQLRGWSDASPGTRERILAVVRIFLAGDEPSARRWFQDPSREAYQMLRLLAARDSTWLDNQHAEFWRRWAPTIVACPIQDDSEDHVALLRRARRHAPDEFLWALAFLTDRDVAQKHVTTGRSLRDCWDDEISAILLAKAHDPAATGKGLAALLALALIRDCAGARELCEASLARAASDPGRALAGALALLIADAERSWLVLTASFAADPALALGVLRDLSSEEVTAMAERCSASRVADVYAWIATTLKDAKKDADALHTALRKQLTGRGTTCALDAIRRLQGELPDDEMLPIAHAMARAALSAKGWMPWSIGDVLRLRPGSPASPCGDAYRALIDALCDLLETQERVRDWLRRSPLPGFGLHELPLGGSSMFDWMARLVDQLASRGLDADELRDRLEQGFPNDTPVIARIHDLWAAVSHTRGWSNAGSLEPVHR